MEAYRLVARDHANLDGVGGLFIAGRWNIKGLRIVYLASSRSLAILEKLVHISDPHLMPKDMVMLRIDIPDSFDINCITEEDLSKNWKKKLLETRYLGSDFLKRKENLILGVPSVVVPEEKNYILNPLLPDAELCKVKSIEQFSFDNRLFK